ncbi:MAG: GtrA family protein [Gammaproteobacteria bacterium]
MKGTNSVQHITGQFLRFATVGGIATAVHYLILITLVQGLGANPVWASGIGFVIGATFNYVLNYRFTFRSNAKHRHAVVKFLLVAGLGLVLNSLAMLVFIVHLGLFYLLAQVLATSLVLLWNFLGNRLWVFRAA